MTGLEKIVEQILEDANAEAENILNAAKQEADAIIKKAESDAAKLKTQSDEKIAIEQTGGEAKAKSSSDLKKRQAILLAKQEMINEVLDRSYDEILHMDDRQYFDMIEKMIEKFALAKEGEICFSQKDMDRLPAGFDKKADAIAKAKGGALQVSEVPVPIEGGFILTYGGIEENCSFKALFNAEREKLADKVHAFLFA